MGIGIKVTTQVQNKKRCYNSETEEASKRKKVVCKNPIGKPTLQSWSTSRSAMGTWGRELEEGPIQRPSPRNARRFCQLQQYWLDGKQKLYLKLIGPGEIKIQLRNTSLCGKINPLKEGKAEFYLSTQIWQETQVILRGMHPLIDQNNHVYDHNASTKVPPSLFSIVTEPASDISINKINNLLYTKNAFWIPS